MISTLSTRAFTGLTAITLAAVVAIAGAASFSITASQRDDAKPAAKAPAPSGEIKAEVITYTMGNNTFRGMLYVPANLAAGEKRPGVLVFHEWWGNTDYAMYRAREVAKLGYVAFAPDMYGNGRITTDPAQAGKWAGELANDSFECKVRLQAAVGELKKRNDVDFTKLGAIGYCMGGTMALEAARIKDNIIAVACFHTSNLVAKDPSDTVPLKAEVLICHGEKDAFVKQKDLDDLTAALKAADRNYMLVTHPGAVHSFTNAHADAYGIKGVAYDKAADEESWRQLKALFDRTIGRK